MDSNGQKQPSVEDLARRLSDMNVEHPMTMDQIKSLPHQFNDSTNLLFHQYQSTQQQQQNFLDKIKNHQQANFHVEELNFPQDDEFQLSGDEENSGSSNSNYALIVTNVDPSVFHDDIMKSKFESLFLNYSDSVKFTYLKSFNRVRVDFKDQQSANAARTHLDHHKLGKTRMRCFNAQLINCQSQDDSGQYLRIPKLTKQFLISPPASPPVGWEPVNEGNPCIDVQLMSAIANLVPGKVHELHPATESKPGIFVEVCEDAQFEVAPVSPSQTSSKKTRIPKTPNPGFQLCDSMDQSSV